MANNEPNEQAKIIETNYLKNGRRKGQRGSKSSYCRVTKAV